MRSRFFPFVPIVCAVALSITGSAFAVITANLPLKQVIDGSKSIFIAKVAEVLPDKPAIVLEQDEVLKNEAAYGRMPINLTGDSEAEKGKHSQIILDRVKKDLPIIVIVSKKDGKKTFAFGYTNGTWFQMVGRGEQQDGKDVVRWTLLHGEPYLRRTFKGTTAELKQIIIDSVKNKKDPPSPNEKEEPGFGEPIKKVQLDRKGDSLSRGTGGLLGVIQLPFIGLIAALAALFPTVFGGLALLMRRWLSILSIASFASIMYFLHTQFPRWIRWTGIHSMGSLWIGMAILMGLGALWSARRYRQSIARGQIEDMQPRKADRIALCALTLIGAGIIIYAIADKEPLLDTPWPEILIFLTGAAAGTFFIFSNYLRTRKLGVRPPLNISAESVMLWAAVLACTYIGALEMGRASVHHRGVTTGDADLVSLELTRKPRLKDEPIWVFEPKENGEIVSTPCITPEHVIVSVFHNEGLSQYGRVYAIDAKDGKEIWRFPNDRDPNNEEEMKPVFCSPVFADGKIYVGEGFHKDENCRLICLDESNGKKLWEFKTKSHTESTPTVGDGLVVFGAGNDGIYVLNAESGAEIWHYTGEKGLHIDSNPVIFDGLVYASSGFSRTHQVNRIFCLDPKTQTEVWGERVEQSAYGSPAIFEDKVFFTTGNSTFSEHRAPARGTVLCRDAKTGKAAWDKALPDTVICRPAVDRDHVYVGCWDGFCYALDRTTGAQKWKKELGSPGVASPCIDRCSVCQTSEVLYIAGSKGAIKAFSPQTGRFYWSLDLSEVNPGRKHITLYGSPVVVREENGPVVHRRLYVPAGLAEKAEGLPTARLYCYEDANDHSKP